MIAELLKRYRDACGDGPIDVWDRAVAGEELAKGLDRIMCDGSLKVEHPEEFEPKPEGLLEVAHWIGRSLESIAESLEAIALMAQDDRRKVEANESVFLMPCDECLKAQAVCRLPWDRERKVCEACWRELTDEDTPIAEADRIRFVVKAKAE